VSVYSNNSPLETSLDESAEITLSNKQASSFAIEYAAIYYGHSQSLKYAVFMEGVDKTWNILNDQRRVNFSRLPPGRYTFNVRAVSSNEDWDNAPVRSLIITVKPPFHLSVWAWLIYLIVAFVIAYFVNHFLRLRRQEKQQIQLERLERSKIEEINRTKIDFFTNISHELKTPLTLIISPLQRLIDNGTPKDLLHEVTEVILRNAQRMSRIVDELMTFSKIEIGKEKLTLHKGNILEFISNISNTFKLLAKEKDINFISIIEDNGEEVWFSITNIEKIVYNLLSNSFKFTPAGGSISIQARLTEEYDNKIYLNIIVTDSGEGIEKQYLDRIFENYFQADLNSNLRGSGIGLSLTKRLVNLHNGSISVDSNVGEGSTFSVAVDVSESSYSKDEKTTEIFDKDFFKKYNYITIGHEIIEKNNILEDEHNEDYIKSILLVEDNDELLKFLYDIFRDNFRVFTAENGEIALEIANREYPDLIISDVMMPVMDGFELCKRIKSDFSTCHIPLILLTAKTGTDDKLEGYGVGADYYIEKPFNARMLEIQVQNIIKTRLSNIESIRNNPQNNVSSTLMNERDCSFVTKLNELIEENIDNQFFSISDITKALNVSRTLLHVKCKKLINVSVTDYIRETRMHKAKALLTAGQNISETAYAVGFSDPGYFSKVFKKQFNISPSDFIKNSGNSEEKN
jgi:signal transduction histidine kinase/DNA-binding response OmpR family regulator